MAIGSGSAALVGKEDEADGVVYQRPSGSRSAYWSYDPVWFICGATGERRVGAIDERMIDADRIAAIPPLMTTFNNGLLQLKCLNNRRYWECYA